MRDLPLEKGLHSKDFVARISGGQEDLEYILQECQACCLTDR